MGDHRGSPEDDEDAGSTHEVQNDRLIRFSHGLRRDVSLLLSEGHVSARDYPVAVVWSEARIVRQRQAARRKQDTALMQMTLASMFDKAAGKRLAKLLKRMDESD